LTESKERAKLFWHCMMIC